VVQVAAGTAHSVALLADGRVFAAGDNSRGQLGVREGGGRADGFVRVDCYGHRVQRVGCGADTTMFLTVDNMVLVTGKRLAGLSVIGGLGSSRVTHLSVGASLAVARTAASDAVVSRCRKRFEVTEDLTRVFSRSVSAGVGHYALVTEDGGAMASGLNAFGQVAAGQMGLTAQGGADARVFRPHYVPLSRVEVPDGYRALSVAAGNFHTLYLLAPVETATAAADT
jgi:alpha-tubulin suppressor-like RCC1 family protein